MKVLGVLEMAAPILGKFWPTTVRALVRVLGSNPMDLRVARLMMSVWAPVSATAWVLTSGGVVAWPTWGLPGGWSVGLWTLRCA